MQPQFNPFNPQNTQTLNFGTKQMNTNASQNTSQQGALIPMTGGSNGTDGFQSSFPTPNSQGGGAEVMMQDFVQAMSAMMKFMGGFMQYFNAAMMNGGQQTGQTGQQNPQTGQTGDNSQLPGSGGQSGEAGTTQNPGSANGGTSQVPGNGGGNGGNCEMPKEDKSGSCDKPKDDKKSGDCDKPKDDQSGNCDMPKDDKKSGNCDMPKNDGDGYNPPKNDGGGYNPPKNDGGGYNPPKNDGGDYNPPKNDGGGYNPPKNDGGGYNPPKNDGGGYNPPKNDGGGYNPPKNDGGGYNPPKNDGGDYNPPKNDGGDYNPPKNDGGGYNPPKNDGGDYNPPKNDGGDYNPPKNDGGDYNPPKNDGGGYNPPKNDGGDYNPPKNDGGDGSYSGNVPSQPDNTQGGENGAGEGTTPNGPRNAEQATQQAIKTQYDSLDGNKDGVLNREELSAARGKQGVDNGALDQLLANYGEVMVASHKADEALGAKQWQGLSKGDVEKLGTTLQDGKNIAQAAALYREQFAADAKAPQVKDTASLNQYIDQQVNPTPAGPVPGQVPPAAPASQVEKDALQHLIQQSGNIPADGSYNREDLLRAATAPGVSDEQRRTIGEISKNREALSWLDGQPGDLGKEELQNILNLMNNGWNMSNLVKEGQSSQNKQMPSTLTGNSKPIRSTPEQNQTERDALRILVDNADAVGGSYGGSDILEAAAIHGDAKTTEVLRRIADSRDNLTQLDGNRGFFNSGNLSKEELQGVMNLLDKGYSLDFLIEEGNLLQKTGNGRTNLHQLQP